MRRAALAVATAIVLGGASFALAQAQPAPAPAAPASAPAATRAPGYLTRETVPDGFLFLPPAPQPGTPRYGQDRQIFRATRSMQGSPRWALALADNNSRGPYMLSAFSCAVGVSLTPENAPRLTLLLGRLSRDSSAITNRAKDQFQRRRPFTIDRGPTCIPQDEGLTANFDYPSGHATWGWSMGLVLAALSPDRATQILTRARAYGESRVVCGVHNASAIEAARSTGGALVSTLQSNADFRADLEAARAELMTLRQTGSAPDAAVCQAEWALTARTPYAY